MSESFRPWLSWDSARYDALLPPPNVPLGNAVNRADAPTQTPRQRVAEKSTEAKAYFAGVLSSTQPRIIYSGRDD